MLPLRLLLDAMESLNLRMLPPTCPFFVVSRLMRVGVVPMARFRWRVRGPLGVLKILVRVHLLLLGLRLLPALPLLLLLHGWLRRFLGLIRSISRRSGAAAT